MRSLEKLMRDKKLTSLSNVVLLSGKAAENSMLHLENKIKQRVEKEFYDPSSEDKEIIEQIKQENLHFVPRRIKQQRDGEYFIQVQQNVREKDVHLFYKFDDKNLDFMELLIMGDTLRRAGVKSVTTYLPYMPYQRQDKKDEGRVPISSKLMFNLLHASMGDRLKRIVTFDLHARQAQGHFDGPLDELSAVPEFATYYRKKFTEDYDEDPSSVLIVSPDSGGAKRANYLASLLRTQYQVLDKKRTGHGKAETRFYLDLDVEGKKIILIDDMIDSGSSLVGEFENDKIGPVQYLKSRGADVYVCATHPILSVKNNISAEERFREAGVPVLFTDSLPEKEENYYRDNNDWMTVLSLDYALAKTFYCNQVGESISQFLDSRHKRLLSKKLDFIISDASNGLVDVE